MQELFKITIIAARDNDQGGWVQLLVFAIMAVFWVIGGLIKAKQNKITEEDFSEEEKKDKKSPRLIRQFEFEPEELHQIEKKDYGKQERQLKPFSQVRVIPSEQITESVKPRLDNRKAMKISGLEEITDQTVTEQLLKFEEPDELKRAILYSEIIGKPVSLR